MCLALAIGGAAVLGAGATVYASDQASSAQRAAAAQASATQQGMFNQIQATEAPWVSQGQQANQALGQFYGLPGGAGGAAPDYSKILSNLPGYQFQLQQGQQAMERNLAARGLLGSGAAQKSLATFGQGLAQNYAGQYTQGLQNLSQLGQAGASGVASAGMNAANQIGSNQIYAGNAAAAGYANQGQAINAGLSGLVSSYGYYNQNLQNPGFTPQDFATMGGGTPTYSSYTVPGSGYTYTYGGGP